MTSRLGLGGAYGATLDRIKGQSGEKARLSMAVLMWISHSAQPLNPDQLCNALVAVFPSVPSALYAPPGLQSRASRASRASISSCRARASVLWERLSSKRVTVGPYSPRRIGNSRIVPAVLTRHLQSSPITCRARQSPTGPGRHPELPGKLRHLRHLQSPPVRPGLSSGRTPRYPSGRPFRYCRPSRPDPKTDGLDAW